MKICTYTMTHDSGFAPNPFNRYCTLAACTPNHMNAQLKPDDWIVGVRSEYSAYLIVYAMKITEVLDFDLYYKDPRFHLRKPIVNGGWKQRCGDNIYFKTSKGKWEQCETVFHEGPAHLMKDTKYPKVFIGSKYYYFGDQCQKVPPNFLVMIKKGRGMKYTRDSKVTGPFIVWLENSFPKKGLLGLPRDRENFDRQNRPKCRCYSKQCCE